VRLITKSEINQIKKTADYHYEPLSKNDISFRNTFRCRLDSTGRKFFSAWYNDAKYWLQTPKEN